MKTMNTGEEAKLGSVSLKMADEAKFFEALQSWSKHFTELASEVQSLSNYASRKSEHYEGYDLALRCLQRIVAHDHALASLLSTRPEPAPANTPLSALHVACSTLVTSGIIFSFFFFSVFIAIHELR